MQKKKGKPEGLPKAQHAARENEHALKKTTIVLLHEQCQDFSLNKNNNLKIYQKFTVHFSHHKTAALHLSSASIGRLIIHKLLVGRIKLPELELNKGIFPDLLSVNTITFE